MVHCHWKGEVHDRDSGSAKTNLALCFGFIFLCQKQMIPLSAQQYAVWIVLWREAKPDWDAFFWMSSICTHRGHEETGQQGPNGDHSGLVEREQVFHRVQWSWNSRTKAEQVVTFNMDCFPGAVTSVDTVMTHDRWVETTIHSDTGLRDRREGFTRC